MHMSNPFKIGDQVTPRTVIFQPGRKYAPGDVGTVTSICPDGINIRLDGASWGNRYSKFELAQAKPDTTPDLSDLRKGDKVTVELILSQDGMDDDGEVRWEGKRGFPRWADASAIVAHEKIAPRGLEVLQQETVVVDKASGLLGTIAGRLGEYYWVVFDGRLRPITRRREELTVSTKH